MTDTVIISRNRDTVLVIGDNNPVTEVILNQRGPAGPRGANSAPAAFEYSQNSASNTWIVNHNLGVKPTATIFSPGGVVVWPEIVHTSNNQFIVYFASPYAGYLRCL